MADVRSRDFVNQETQRLYSPLAAPLGNDMGHWFGDKLGFMQDTVPLDDDPWIEGETGTQVMDDETQTMHLAHEPQEASLVGETQLLETPECLDTQLLDQFDDEVAADSDDNVTDVLDYSCDLFDGDSLKRGGNRLSGEENTQHSKDMNRSMEVSNAPPNEQRSSGNIAKFTSVRTAAFRATGLAARGATLKLPNSDPRSILTSCHSSDQGAGDNTSLGSSVGEEVEQLCVPCISGEETNKSRIGNKTARKLFADDSTAETKEGFLNCIADDCDDERAGLSYVDSQEPGEASQASALDFVEKLINDSCLDFEAKVDHGKRTVEKLKFASSLKGPQVLAKKVSQRGGAVGNDVFKWDDNREDEGGGDIFCRRKEEFFGGARRSQGSSTAPREPKGKLLRGGETELVNAADKRLVHSDSRLLHRSLKKNGRNAQEIEKETKKNLVNELDKVSEDNTKTCERHEVVDVGPDTQMAAEAIDALHLVDSGKLDVDTCSLMEKKHASGEKRGVSCGGVVTRQSKRRKSINAIEREMKLSKTRSKKVRSVPSKTCRKNTEGSLKGDKLGKSDKLVRSSIDMRLGGLSKEQSASVVPSQSSGCVGAEVPSFPRRRRSVRNSRSCFNESSRNAISTFETPVKSPMPLKNVSPICMGDEYLERSCKNSSKSASLREIRGLTSPSAEPTLEFKSTRRRRDLGGIQVLFSQHLNEDVDKHQKKILARLGISEASSIGEATHFVVDKFMRTRNMLEAIASGKPVVTTQWLESIEQVKIYIDEDAYILRDLKKEREFGFSMPVSLARARRHPLLEGRKVFITPNTKPGKETISRLVKAVEGQAVERVGRSALKDDKVPDNLLVLSCEEDYNICLPFLERGAEVYSSELLLNGIVTQKLEFERYRLFADHVKRTRSTIWLKNKKGKFEACHR